MESQQNSSSLFRNKSRLWWGIAASFVLATLFIGAGWLYRTNEQGEASTPVIYSEDVLAEDAMPNEQHEQAGLAALAQGDVSTAIAELEQAKNAQEISETGLLALADAYWQSERAAEAIPLWQEAAPSVRAYNSLAVAFRDLSDFPAMLSNLKESLVLQPSQAEVNYQIGLLYAATEPDAALAYLEQAAQLDPTIADRSRRLQSTITSARLRDEPAFTFMETGRILASFEAWDLAAEAFRQATLLRPDYAEAWAFFGEALQQQPQNHGRETDRPLAALKRALVLDPQSISANIFTGMYWRRQGRLETATVYLLTAARSDPANPALQVELGHIEVEKGNMPEAQKYYEEAIGMSPDDSVYWRILAEFSLNNQVQPKEIALPAARQALLLAPEDAKCLDLMGHTLYQLGDHLNSERFLLQAIETDPAYALAHLHLGMVYLLQEKRDLSKTHLGRAVELEPESAAARQAERLLSRYFP
jgi:tetratricopeptide (TPR) repeat protein